MNRPRKFLGVILWGIFTCDVHAAIHDQPNQVQFSAGVASSVFDDGIHLKDSFAMSAAYYRRLSSWMDLGAEAGGFFGAKVSGIAPEAADANGNGKVDSIQFRENSFGATIHLTPQVRFGPRFGNRSISFNPYIAGGGGPYWVFIASTKGLPDSVDGHSTHGGFNYGGGFSVLFGTSWGIGGDFRMHQVIDRGGPDTAYRVTSLHVDLLF